MDKWETLARFVEIRSPWLTLIGEKLKDDQERVLDYWRVEKADSVVIISIYRNQFILPQYQYRPGLGVATLDFPGGRVSSTQTPLTVIPSILHRELAIVESAIASITPLNTTGWAINSSFSNQKLYGFVAEIANDFSLNSQFIGAIYPITNQGIDHLLSDLTCLQCRAVLTEWLLQRQ